MKRSCKQVYRSSVLCSVKMVTATLTRARPVNIIYYLITLEINMTHLLSLFIFYDICG
jgi:hypothetical protein